MNATWFDIPFNAKSFILSLIQTVVQLRLKICNLSRVASADPRLLGALRKTVSPAGGGGAGGLKEWMKRICLCFTLSRITLMESA